ncbi:unnamed protein product [marine sediment metagenome]|uniref:Uncharacterized protein n=1 Tax=marine sediment metagenome TaxID=412755 RepID=X0WJ87_9ZZZZ
MKAQCYWIDPAQDAEPTSGYVPSLVVENESGHSPLAGRGKYAAPWTWGKTYEKAVEVCKHVNNRNGVTPEEANRIVASSQAAI